MESSSASAESAQASSSLLQGQVAIITGGGRGIGLAIAEAFAREGAKLVLNDFGCERNGDNPDPQIVEQAAAQLRAAGAEVVTHHGDVAEPAAVQQLFQLAEDSFESAHILVNNAGIIADKSLFELSIEDWDSVVRTHLRGSFLCTQAFAQLARKKRSPGVIINMTSTSGMLGNLGQTNESAAKAGIYGLTRTSSIELQRFRIRVNALAAIARTRLTEDLPIFEKVSSTMESKHIAPAAVFLASDLAEDLSGTVLSVAGGRISTFELAESQGRVKEAEDGLWSPQEIAENYDSIARK